MLDKIKGILNWNLPATGPIEYRDLDLFLRWKFDETTGTRVNDSSPFGLNPGTYANTPTLNQPGLSFHTNKSVYFDSASSERAEGAFNQTLGASWSVSIWVNLTTLSSIPYLFTLGKGSGGGVENFIEVVVFSDGGIIVDGNSNGIYFGRNTAASEININTSYNIIITCSAVNGLRLYKNSALRTLSAGLGGAESLIKDLTLYPINNLCVGCAKRATPTYSNYINGKVDDCAIWNRELTFTEVSKLYTVGLP